MAKEEKKRGRKGGDDQGDETEGIGDSDEYEEQVEDNGVMTKKEGEEEMTRKR